MNKNMNFFYIPIVAFLMVNCLFGQDKIYSKSEYLKYSEMNTDGETRLKIFDPSLFAAFSSFRDSMIKNEFKSVYDLRTESYKKIVSPEIFSESVAQSGGRITNIFLIKEDSCFGEKTSLLKCLYVMELKSNSYVVASQDHWDFNKKEKKWEFISNSLSWGSSVQP